MNLEDVLSELYGLANHEREVSLVVITPSVLLNSITVFERTLASTHKSNCELRLHPNNWYELLKEPTGYLIDAVRTESLIGIPVVHERKMSCVVAST